MEELLKKLRDATGPARQLDRAISVYLVESGKLEGGHPLLKDVPLYTSSFDAAATLIPSEGYKWEVRSASKTRKAASIVWNESMMGGPSYEAHTPYLALCIAAIQAERVWESCLESLAAARQAR